RRRDLAGPELPDAGGAQAIEDVGEVGQQDDTEPGEKRVRVTELRHAGPLPRGEGVLRAPSVGPRVAFEHDHAGEVAGEGTCRREAGEAPPQHDGRGRPVPSRAPPGAPTPRPNPPPLPPPPPVPRPRAAPPRRH